MVATMLFAVLIVGIFGAVAGICAVILGARTHAETHDKQNN